MSYKLNKTRFPKRNDVYKSVEEYLHNLSPLNSITSHESIKEEDFLKFLDIIEVVFKIENIEFNYNEINNLEEFLENLFERCGYTRNSYSSEGKFYYDKEKEQVSISDSSLNNVQQTLFTLHILPFWNIKKKINKKLWFYIGLKLNDEILRVEETELSDYPISYLRDISLEEPEEYEEEIQEIKTYNEIVDFISKLNKKIKSIKIDEKELNEDELELYKIINEINNYDYETAIDFIQLDEEEAKSCDWCERYNNSNEEYDIELIKHDIANSLYSGQHIITLTDDCCISKEYLSNLNESSNNSMWPMNLWNSIKYDINGKIEKCEKQRNIIINHSNNFIRFNELTEKIEKQ